MRELDRNAADTRVSEPARGGRLAVGVVGPGRAGRALAAALRAAGYEVDGPVGRGRQPGGDAVLLCVPDSEIGSAAATVAGTARFVGHVSGATPLAALEPSGGEAFGLHPLQTLTGEETDLSGCGCAIAGSTSEALELARRLALDLGMDPVEIDDERRAAYHAAASIASNFLVTLEAAAERVASGAGIGPEEARRLLGPLVRTTVDNWLRLGPAGALTGPVARGDEGTVAAQRAAVAEVAPEALDLFDQLVAGTKALVDQRAINGWGRGGVGDAQRGWSNNGPISDEIRPTPAMQTVRTVAELRAALRPLRARGTVGLVPTMGALHEGHLSLIRRARSDCATVVVSLFVNPTQFGEGEDLDAYPRDEERDARLAAAEGADILFAPVADEVYPPEFGTTVSVGGVTEVLEGDPAQRGPEHFEGVATVVTKLFNMVQPDVAYFGQKDAQQAVVIRKLVHDLDLPVRIEVLPTVRDDDGLALSSRNAFLGPEERERALALSRALRAAHDEVAAGHRDAEAVLTAARQELAARGVEPEYLELRSPDDLAPVARVNGRALLAVAARVGRARLIDNTILGDEATRGDS